MNKNKTLKRQTFFSYLPPGKHHMHGYSLVRACNLHIKQGKHQYAEQPKSIKLFKKINIFYSAQVLRSPKQPHIPVAHSF
jgi:hypothetical protein